jgi:hypothetical protein
VIFVKLLLIYLGLAALAWIFAQFIHNYFYTGAPKTLNWRAPAAAGILWLLGLAAPVALPVAFTGESSGWPVSFNDLFLFTAGKTEAEFAEFTIPTGDKRKGTVYKRIKVQRGIAGDAWEYRDDTGKPMPLAPPVLLAKEGDKAVRFEIVKDDKGYIDRGPDPSNPKPARWRDEDGRVMTETNFGKIVPSGGGATVFHLFAMVVNWAIWFLCIWLLLMFQWPHALGLSIPIWLVWTFTLNFLIPWLG